jgi:hypothetical protein
LLPQIINLFVQSFQLLLTVTVPGLNPSLQHVTGDVLALLHCLHCSWQRPFSFYNIRRFICQLICEITVTFCTSVQTESNHLSHEVITMVWSLLGCTMSKNCQHESQPNMIMNGGCGLFQSTIPDFAKTQPGQLVNWQQSELCTSCIQTQEDYYTNNLLSQYTCYIIMFKSWICQAETLWHHTKTRSAISSKYMVRHKWYCLGTVIK